MRSVLERMQLVCVYSQGAPLSEAFFTVGTCVGLLAGMGSYVLCQIVLHTEGLLTVVTLERFLAYKRKKKENGKGSLLEMRYSESAQADMDVWRE